MTLAAIIWGAIFVGWLGKRAQRKQAAQEAARKAELSRVAGALESHLQRRFDAERDGWV